MMRPPIIRAYLGDDELIVDSFAGGGDASTGIELALGRSPDLAVNHDPQAIAMHAANHPATEHRLESVWAVDPRIACRGKRVALAWFSPDCKHHSKAAGGKPRDQKIRGLAWVAVSWAQRVRPRVIALENVEEFRDWGPLHRRHTDGCTGEARERRIDGRSRETQGCRKGCMFGMPIKARRGETFRAFVGKLKRLGYGVEHRLLRACDYGAPTTRRRLFLIARCDGRPIAWPSPTHGPLAAPYRTAAEVIDWSISCPSIFHRARPLADKTLARIARGVRKFVLESARPFVIPVNHGGVGRRDHRVHDLAKPMPTITGGARGGQAPRIYDAQQPLRTIVAQGEKHAVCTAFLAKHYGDRVTGGWNGGSAADKPIDTITVRDHHSLVAASLTKLYGTSTGADVRAPMPTVTSDGQHIGAVAAHLVRYNGDRPGAERVAAVDGPIGTLDTSRRYGLVAAFLARYNRTSTGQLPDAPIGTLDTTDRYALVTVTIDGEEYAIVDIGMRMLTPRELFRAQGFPDGYRIDPEHEGEPLTKTAQIRMCGNSVCPPIAAAIVRAQFSEAA